MARDPDPTTTFYHVRNAMLLHLVIEDTEVAPLGDDIHVRLILREGGVCDDATNVQACAKDIIFAVAMMSFLGLPYEELGLYFDDVEMWTTTDMEEHLCWEGNVLKFHVDTLRGRPMKTAIEVHTDGRVVLETFGRGDIALRWVAVLQKEVMVGRPKVEPPVSSARH